jgi:hypothetical protein
LKKKIIKYIFLIKKSYKRERERERERQRQRQRQTEFEWKRGQRRI